MPATLLCPSCSDPIAEAQRFCPSCGTNLDVADTPTGTAPRPATPLPRRPGSGARAEGSGPRTPGSSAVGLSVDAAQGRFVPGTLLADRYRIVGLLGRGGMGEVCRADDLKLEQPVALKFLPLGLEADRERLERFYNEVRTARQVSHPAVCRVYDIGEVDGQHFISMEYVDGENLAHLQRRIGRLPADKAMEIAQQLCAGVAAAHERGVLHRDLKPENVMLDGQGNVRITDFGLAGLEDSIRGDDVRSGTPAYMSPEQLLGREVTARSDVYSLGLVLYELFTGRKAFTGKTYAELLRKHRDEMPIDPRLLVPDLAPAVERTILRCIDKEPARRPASARSVSVLLTGGDPLAAAIAAGETPSPELVASAGEEEGLRPAVAWVGLAVTLAATIGAVFVAERRQLVSLVPFTRSPAVLQDRARELVRALGHPGERADESQGFSSDVEYFRWAQERDPSPRRWEALASGEPPVLGYWHRQGARPLVATNMVGRVSWGNPPIQLAGMAGVRLDLRGRLIAYYSVPPQVDDPPEGASPAPDWSRLFAEAQLDPGRLTPVAPKWTPPFFCDARAAWEGAWPHRPEIPLRVEAAAYRGRPVSFFLVSPWTRPERMQPYAFTSRDRMAIAVLCVLFFLLLAAGAVLARRNIRLGRGDRRAAFRIAGFLFATQLAGWVLAADHVADIEELALAARAASASLLLVAILWLYYVALEPYVRRHRPQTLISWTRLLAGGFRDTVVGRDVLIGAAWGALLAVVFRLAELLPAWLGQPAAWPSRANLDVLLSTRQLFGFLLRFPLESTLLGMASLLLFLLLHMLLRRDGPTFVALAAILTAVQASGMYGALWLTVPLAAVIMLSYAVLLLRFGLLSAVAGVLVAKELLALPLSPDPASFAASSTLWATAVVAAVAIAAFRIAVKGPLFGRPLLEE